MPDTAAFKQKLLDQKAELEDRISRVKQNIRRAPSTTDWEDLATERENNEVVDALGNAAVEELEHVKTALTRIERGCYFICDRCRHEIEVARLEAMPYATVCRHCAENGD
ncbi:MAG TPA: hypothetical protein DCZ12_18950 [Gammaproteobacteria bacterium]|nr:hypothetical protein [Gammaproteobacteria bacterium]HCO61540.1 hypothetical protein [Porticoccaceae bacterium]